MEGNAQLALIQRMRSTFFQRAEMFDTSRPWYVDVSDMSFRAGAGRIRLDDDGLFVVDNGGTPKPVLTAISASSVSVNSESLAVGDVMIGDNTASKVNLLFDQSAGNLLMRSGTTTLMTFDPTTGITIPAGSAFATTTAVNFYSSSTRIGSVYGYTDGSTFNAARLESVTSSSSRTCTAWVFAGHENGGVARARLYATQYTSPNTITTPTAEIFLESDQPNDQALIQLSVDSDAASATTLSLDLTGSTLTNGIKSFKIDHPLDPENRWLVHAAIETDGNRVIYGGRVKFGADGSATVTMPDWFEPLADNPVITFGAVGKHMPLYVDDIHERGFTIYGGEAGREAHWTLIADRADPWAAAHPMAVEPMKADDERGDIAAWKEYGITKERSLFHNQNARRIKRDKR